ncbi:hypothetical protein CHLNCDRAFT_59287 [Chlorella variabilis]|uniref:Solute-binding protein family 3/N-terminal domain-containing protein n=1 Tax=Chlorella variabilis TaxID=554065 RepID=E1ZSE4_CHLVA|nr:hypothetical protein CHLNCDRAFT_59287 [Chlorella variabilis]EFN51229.1 hypothetical protein CHLNCDRAFT_59287 [Chlorella variabilis]|eukprot:XP_005843331.1 hypothetical protein CHLNCDRAFT_59287 [Chlorella variabilis]
MPRPSQPSTMVVLALLALATGALAKDDSEFAAELVPAVVGVAGYDDYPYITYDAETGNATGFLAPLLEQLCTNARLECEIAPVPALKDMIPWVQNGTVDFIIHTLSLTEERAKLVDFVHPAFYSAGVALYTTPTQGGLLAAAGGWEGVSGEPICFVAGYYATGALVEQYGVVPVEMESVPAAVQGVSDGKCVAAAYDTGQPALGLPEAAGVTPAMNAPYAIPVAKGNDGLRRRLSAATVELMMDGNNSPLLEWEQEYLTDKGVLSNANLASVVQAVSYFE